MAASKEEIGSQALQLLGERGFSSFDDTDASRIVGEMYETRILYLISEYPWRFSVRYVQLDKLVETPAAQWASVHQMPTGRVEPFPFALYNSAGENAPPIKNFTVSGQKILSNETYLWCQYQVRPPEVEWPPHFYQFAVVDLAAYVCLPVTRDEGKAAHWQRTARGTPQEEGHGGMWRSATAADARAKPPEQFRDDQLIAARLGYT